MMKLLLAVIATCALVVSPTCIKIKHQLRSNAPTIHVLISNGNTQLTSQVGRNGSHRFITDNLSSMTLAPAGSQTIQLSYDEIFPLTDAAVCTEVHPLSAGGCADGVCCKVSISMYTITDAIIMTARVNNRNADGNPQFWKCEQEIQVPGVTNTELSPEELVTDILHGESPGGHCLSQTHCEGNNLHLLCNLDQRVCECVSGYVTVGGECRKECDQPGVTNQCHSDAVCEEVTCDSQGSCTYICSCNYGDGYYGDGTVCAVAASACTADTANCHSVSGQSLGACATGYATVGDGTTCIDINECDDDDEHECLTKDICTNTGGSYTCDCNKVTTGYYGDGFKHSATNPHTEEDGTECTEKKATDETCELNEECLGFCRTLNNLYRCQPCDRTADCDDGEECNTASQCVASS